MAVSTRSCGPQQRKPAVVSLEASRLGRAEVLKGRRKPEDLGAERLVEQGELHGRGAQWREAAEAARRVNKGGPGCDRLVV
ncbi:hypothetical protein TRIUR3_29808 [Triticum urartu]|uniref:Uncharacterized protein n=1 Tax=Triticum urartu TaxID=4572 RepID=M7ZBB9_TRIUA|nr:hypothetical protein TRIUR3_29808 [Triticum urartu]